MNANERKVEIGSPSSTVLGPFRLICGHLRLFAAEFLLEAVWKRTVGGRLGWGAKPSLYGQAGFA